MATTQQQQLPAVYASVGLTTNKRVFEGRSGSRSTLLAECKVELDGIFTMPVSIWGRLTASNGRPACSFDVSIPRDISVTDPVHAAIVAEVNKQLTAWPYLEVQSKQALARLVEAERQAATAEKADAKAGRRTNTVGTFEAPAEPALKPAK